MAHQTYHLGLVFYKFIWTKVGENDTILINFENQQGSGTQILSFLGKKDEENVGILHVRLVFG
jgi:hypothetical protein